MQKIPPLTNKEHDLLKEILHHGRLNGSSYFSVTLRRLKYMRVMHKVKEFENVEIGLFNKVIGEGDD
jgi:hypothetical protein